MQGAGGGGNGGSSRLGPVVVGAAWEWRTVLLSRWYCLPLHTCHSKAIRQQGLSFATSVVSQCSMLHEFTRRRARPHLLDLVLV